MWSTPRFSVNSKTALSQSSRCFVIYQIRRAQFFRSFQFFIARRCNDNARSESRRKLQSENRNAARALQQNRIVGFHSARFEKRVIRRHRRARQSRRFFKRKMIGNTNQDRFRQTFRTRAKRRPDRRRARCAPFCASIAPSIQPCIKIGVTRSPTLNFVTASPISTTSPAPSENGTSGVFSFGLYSAFDHHQIAVIQRRGVKFHLHFICLRRWLVAFGKRQIFYSEFVYLVDFHNFFISIARERQRNTRKRRQDF